MRVGIGYDAHRFGLAKPLVLGGVLVTSERGLEAFSDGDVVLHALMDALLGAAALGDIGTHFPPGDERFADISSLVLLRRAAALLGQRGLKVVNVDISVVAEAPRLAPHVDAMRSAIGEALDLEPSVVSVKATTNEGMGFVGRGEGIAAFAVALLE